MPAKGSHLSEETKQRLREARKRQIHPSLVVRGVTREMVEDAYSKGLKWCCGKCKGFVPRADFSCDRSGRCRKCASEALAVTRASQSPERHAECVQGVKAWRTVNQKYDYRYRLFKVYGKTEEWYNAKLAEQGSVCALCFSTIASRRALRFFVDHNHATGAVRGLLCAKCNTALERFESDPNWPARAAAYLVQYENEKREDPNLTLFE